MYRYRTYQRLNFCRFRGHSQEMGTTMFAGEKCAHPIANCMQKGHWMELLRVSVVCIQYNLGYGSPILRYHCAVYYGRHSRSPHGIPSINRMCIHAGRGNSSNDKCGYGRYINCRLVVIVFYADYVLKRIILSSCYQGRVRI